MAGKREFLGRGWRFPVTVNRTGGVSTSTDAENVRQSIFIILGTAPGERLRRPDFGCDIHDLMFAPNNPTTAGLAEFYCEEALAKWEPRIANIEASATPNQDEPSRLDIRITYSIRGSNRNDNLVFPFYLQTEEGE
ncbi:MAG: GPW/gp25 family protein [Deltaproteobacteria bacterium]|nr:GPW/gp25 family protein [Deltaproteobacteria bacterium]